MGYFCSKAEGCSTAVLSKQESIAFVYFGFPEMFQKNDSEQIDPIPLKSFHLIFRNIAVYPSSESLLSLLYLIYLLSFLPVNMFQNFKRVVGIINVALTINEIFEIFRNFAMSTLTKAGMKF